MVGHEVVDILSGNYVDLGVPFGIESGKHF